MCLTPPAAPHPAHTGGAPSPPTPTRVPLASPLRADISARASPWPPRSDRGRLSPAVKTRRVRIPRPGPGWGRRGRGGVKRLGQARGLEPAPRPHWLAPGVRPESGAHVPIHCHHPSSPLAPTQPYSPPFSSSSSPCPSQPRLPGLERSRRSDRGRLELPNSKPDSEREGSRDGEGAERRGKARRERRVRPEKARARDPADPERWAAEGGVRVARAEPSGSSGTAAAAAGRPPPPLRARSSAVRAFAPRAAAPLPSRTGAPGRGLSLQPAASSSRFRGGSGAASLDGARGS